MSDKCNNDCSSCSEDCDDRKEKNDFSEKPHNLSKIKKVIGIVSGKGGVGKSLVTSLLAVYACKRGFKTAILDADITGPSIPKAFGLKEKALGTKDGLYPIKTKTGISVMSVNFLLENETDPVVWRGPLIAGAVKQFWTDVIWENIDIMFIDMPPGTGDVPLTVFQSIKVDGIVIVTSPQELVNMIVAKATKMANMMKIPIIGIVENMSFFECPNCLEKHNIFGESKIEEIAKSYEIDIIEKMPIDSKISKLCDQGMIENIEEEYLDGLILKIGENI